MILELMCPTKYSQLFASCLCEILLYALGRAPLIYVQRSYTCSIIILSLNYKAIDEIQTSVVLTRVNLFLSYTTAHKNACNGKSQWKSLNYRSYYHLIDIKIYAHPFCSNENRMLIHTQKKKLQLKSVNLWFADIIVTCKLSEGGKTKNEKRSNELFVSMLFMVCIYGRLKQSYTIKTNHNFTRQIINRNNGKRK